LPGITINRSDDEENASNSIRVNPEFHSNEMDENLYKDKKHDEQRISTLYGIIID
jgi:hypothetical protein